MKRALLVAAMAASVPGAVLARADEAKHPAPLRGCEETGRADSALPARASSVPAPQLGTVAPTTRVPSHTATPSRRAMAALTDAGEANSQKTTLAKINIRELCEHKITPAALERGGTPSSTD